MYYKTREKNPLIWENVLPFLFWKDIFRKRSQHQSSLSLPPSLTPRSFACRQLTTILNTRCRLSSLIFPIFTFRCQNLHWCSFPLSKERCAGVDTLALVSRILHRSRTHLQSLLLKSNTAIVEDFFEHVVDSVPDLTEHIHRTTAGVLLRNFIEKTNHNLTSMNHSGYDFGYLLKLLTCRSLPDSQAGIFNLIKIYFPMVYDIQHMMNLHGGLNKLAKLLEVERVSMCHQAGSDSLLTSCTFRKLRDNFFNGSTEIYAGVLYGLGVQNG
ncbi:hypothetical protein CXB51_034636 [Gossypium anomalum]|uniref:Syndetin C-terminal domain-containing protein n=1 Tax=Gossypium anomalum TaxID=47600 RepID=A0A8J6CF49_9ROSI|nr:hypothetical protein CXB51_034636 [Gossypium anomalum]